MDAEKRARSSNFSKEEELLLLHEIYKFKHILECKTTNKISNTEKENAWKKVLDAFNSKNLAMRTMNQLKAKYDNLKTKARKEVAKRKLYLNGTGGGPGIKDELDAVIIAILDIINMKTVVGFPCVLDSDADANINMDDTDTETNTETCSEAETNILVQSLPIEHEVGIAYVNDVTGDNSCLVQVVAAEPVEFPDRTNMVGIPESTACSSISLSDKTPKNRKRVKSAIMCETNANWSTYIPTKLQKKTNEKLRPVRATQNLKDEYYKVKLALLKEAEKKNDEECELRIKQSEEEHRKKMMLLDLDIELKKIQIKRAGL